MRIFGGRKTEQETEIGNKDSGKENTGTSKPAHKSKDVLDRARVSVQISSRKPVRNWL